MSVPILVTAFCRPQLTIKAVSALLDLRPNSEIIVSQDGKIPGFFENEHEITRIALMEMERNHPQIKVNLRDINLGLTQHLVDVFHRIFESNTSVIFLEEDMQISGAGLTYLELIEKDFDGSHRTAYSTTNHPQTAYQMDFRLSYFPEQWGISINANTYEGFVEEFKRKQIDRSIVRTVVKQAGFGKFKSEFLTDFWTNLLRQEVNAPHGWDALLQWTLWKNHSPSKVSLENQIVDLGGFEGAISARTSKLDTVKKSSKVIHSETSESICIFCEQQDAARRGFSAISQLRARTQIRTRIRTLIEMRKYR
jgi:hypothetical protein